jgi:hypothetical protein
MGRALSSTLMAPMSQPEPAPPRPLGGMLMLARLQHWSSIISAAAAFAFGCMVAVMLMAEPSPSRIAAPPSVEVAPPPLPEGPPAPAAWLHRQRPAPPAPAAEAEEQWDYKPVPRTTAYGPPIQRPVRPAVPPARPATGAVAGATAVLRALAQGPPMQAEAPAPADSFAVLTLTTEPDHALVTIDGVRQPQHSNASFPLEPGEHVILVEKLGYLPQQLAPIDVRAGQKMRASLTLAPGPPDSLSTR